MWFQTPARTIFVPTRTASEWSAFLGNKPSTVAATDCVTCNGTLIAGFCWYKGNLGQSCDQVCAPHGGVNLAGTRDYAGSNGTPQNCANVAAVLEPGVTSYGTYLYNVPLCDGATNWGFACHIVPSLNTTYRCEYPTKTDTGFMTVERICACNN
jgi:hypothetical protein